MKCSTYLKLILLFLIARVAVTAEKMGGLMRPKSVLNSGSSKEPSTINIEIPGRSSGMTREESGDLLLSFLKGSCKRVNCGFRRLIRPISAWPKIILHDG